MNWKLVFTGAVMALAISWLGACSHATKKNDTLTSFKQVADAAFTEPVRKNNVKAYMIIPNTGCSGCISEAEHILGDFVSKKYPVRFILTNIISAKTLRLKLGDSITSSKNVYADMSNLTYGSIKELKNIYPAIFYLNNDGDVDRFEYMEPDNPSALKHLYDFLQIKEN